MLLSCRTRFNAHEIIVRKHISNYLAKVIAKVGLSMLTYLDRTYPELGTSLLL
jgi:hypothetical protein